MSDVEKSVHSVQEQEVLAYWAAHKIFEKSVSERPEDKPYTFYDGPPFATGLPHYGHIVASVIKDVVPRFWTMKGYRVERRWGWDCHGLPIENIVEKKFDLKSKKDIEQYGIGKFNESCEALVLDYAEDWKTVIRRLGRWVDMDNAYRTMDLPFMESIWWVFKSLWDKGLIYEGYKPMQLCPRCETTLSNFEVSDGYADATDITVTVGFELTSGPYAGAQILVWTTTPWTLPGNVLLAMGADMEYVLVEAEEKKYIVAKARLEQVFKDKDYTVLETFIGNNLSQSSYDPIFPYYLQHANAYRVVAAEFVSEDSGTGFVHIAPAYGADDMMLGEAENVKPLFHVKTNGQFVPEVSEPLEAEGYKVTGIPVKAKGVYSDIDIQIIKWLAHHGKLFAKEKIIHSYPHCWRCDTPLLNYASTSWFVKVSTMNDALVNTNQNINWVPDHMKVGRFGKWLEGARDWAISRSRFWGTPLPVWKSEDGQVLVIGSKEELEKLVGHEVKDLHKHVIDNLTFTLEGREYTRIPEVLDCWFESGSMPYSQQHYPFNKDSGFDQKFPAQFIAEGQDQTRGWFYTLHVLANALFGKAAYENVIVNGIMLAEDGKKMSKRLNNYPDPMVVMEKYGADAVRYYLMSSPVVRAENVRFAESGVDEVVKKFITILRNCLSFYKLYAEHDDGREPNQKHVLDAWIVARLNETLVTQTKALEAYELSDAARVLQVFVTDLSTWYVRRSRDRMKIAGKDRAEALATLRTVLATFSKMLAPFMPFLAEVVYQESKAESQKSKQDAWMGNSVHLEHWPEPYNLQPTTPNVLEAMGEVRAIVSRIMDVRDQSGKAVKQVLGHVTITTPSGNLAKDYLDVILDEVNIKQASVKQGSELMVEVDLTLTPELIREGMARELTRRVNGLRKDAGLTIADRIELKVWSESLEVEHMITEHAQTLAADTLSAKIEFVKSTDIDQQLQFRVAEQDIWIGF
jgi:isoleucyl-tRNA synthetase